MVKTFTLKKELAVIPVLKEGFKTTLIEDATQDLDKGAIKGDLKHIKREGGQNYIAV